MKPISEILLVVAAAVLLELVTPFSASAATTNYVAYGGPTPTDYNFRPSNLTIKAGDTVIWTNAGGIHTVTGETANEPLCGSTQNVQACTNTFNIPGIFTYECLDHYFAPYYMTGVVNVVGITPSPAVLTNLVWTNGNFAFKVLSTANHTNIVQATTSLAAASNWVSLDTNVPATNSFLFTDTNADQLPFRFYRVVSP